MKRYFVDNKIITFEKYGDILKIIKEDWKYLYYGRYYHRDNRRFVFLKDRITDKKFFVISNDVLILRDKLIEFHNLVITRDFTCVHLLYIYCKLRGLLED